MASEEGTALLLQLLDAPVDLAPLAALTPQERRTRTFALLGQLVLYASQRQPLVLAVENLHWIDPTSEEWLTTLAARLGGTALLLLTTYRSGYRLPWLAHSWATQVALPPLTPPDSLAVVQAVPQAAQLPARFKHVLLQEAAYQSLLQRTRQQVHQRIAQALAAQFPETMATQPELLARHYTAAGLQAEALPYWHQAGQRAMARSAYAEALHHLTTGLEVLATVPETPARHQHELDLLTALAQVWGVTKSPAAPELEPVLTRAAALVQQVGEPSQHAAVLYALWTFRNVREENQAAQAVAEQLLALAQRQHDPALLLGAYHALGVTLGNVGAFTLTLPYLEQGIALSDAQRHATPHTGSMQNPRVTFRALVLRDLWALGYPDQAMQRSQEALTIAHALAHPWSLVDVLRFRARLHALRREWQTTQAHAETLLALATEHGFARYVALGTFFRGWALAAQGEGAEGIAQMRQGRDALRATGAVIGIISSALPEAYRQVGQVDKGLHLLAEALARKDTTGERSNEAELHRLHGELLLHAACGVQNAALAAEECFQQALAVARHQQAKSYELRAAMSLSRLWQQQGKRAEAYQLLAPIYGWFTEGFDTADLQEAKALLEGLA